MKGECMEEFVSELIGELISAVIDCFVFFISALTKKSEKKQLIKVKAEYTEDE